MVVLPPRDSHPFRSQHVADLALGDGLLKLGLVESGQFLLGEGQVLSLPLPQPGPPLRGGLVEVTVAMVNERLPGRASLTITAAELGEVVPAEEKAQFLAEGCEVLSLVETLQELLLGQSSFDLTDGVVFHWLPPCGRAVLSHALRNKGVVEGLRAPPWLR
jgi:hypothetical protein